MKDYSEDYGPFDGVVWLNASHQGPLPKAAVAALDVAVGWKRSPHFLSDSSRFTKVPQRLRTVLAKLINCPDDDIILGNSASYGLHLIANGIQWQPGDEVLVVKGDFPATILPWLGLARRGVKVRAVPMRDGTLHAEDLQAAITDRTRLFCASWVFSFLGVKLDLPSPGEVCRKNNVRFVINSSQALGTQPLDVAQGHIDALTNVGFKWLCGPYGTGFCWMNPEFRESLVYNQAYWLSMQTADDLKGGQEMPVIRENLGARKYDVFGTANFFNFVPWTASVNYILEVGVGQVKSHNDMLIDRLIAALDSKLYVIKSPIEADSRSTIVIVSHRDPNRNDALFKALRDKNVYISLRNGSLRFSPHIYNTVDQVKQAADILNEKGM